MADRDDYALRSATVADVEAPTLPYQPPRPKKAHRIAPLGIGQSLPYPAGRRPRDGITMAEES